MLYRTHVQEIEDLSRGVKSYTEDLVSVTFNITL